MEFFKQNDSPTSILGVENGLGLISSNEVDGRKNIQSIKTASSVFITYRFYRRIIKEENQIRKSKESIYRLIFDCK